jgi:hypothetical protein
MHHANGWRDYVPDEFEAQLWFGVAPCHTTSKFIVEQFANR